VPWEFLPALYCAGLDLIDVDWSTGDRFAGISWGLATIVDWESSNTGGSGRSAEDEELDNLEDLGENPLCWMMGLGSDNGGVDGGDMASWVCTGRIVGDTVVGVTGSG
jgi:hypothetical protein